MLYAIDASIYIFRAWFSIPSTVTGNIGQSVNAAYGFTRFLTEFIEQVANNNNFYIIAFDQSLTRSFRNDIYPPYKMNRELPPEELKNQFELCQRIAEAIGLNCVASERYEADDIIGTFTKMAQSQALNTTIVSADKDLAQLLSDSDELWDFARNKRYKSQDIKEKFGVFPNQITDYLGLCGDAVDNIPGVPGVGAKTAAKLLQHFDDMDQLFANLGEINQLNFRGAKSLPKKLDEHESQARLSKQLATIMCEVPVNCDLAACKAKPMDAVSLSMISEELGGRAQGLFERINNTLNRN